LGQQAETSKEHSAQMYISEKVFNTCQPSIGDRPSIVSEHLYQMADLIETRGHAKDYVEIEGRLCIQGAAHVVCFGQAHKLRPDARLEAITAAVAKHLGIQCDSLLAWNKICLWNNSPARTKDEVLSMLRAAAANV
jgi:hypothetical protein